ncbi:hypothetical protein ACJ72_07539 [Emergomyces africanus]|uniref:Uncharacterized protein n=1 Tax=Emergomyces africanus TaxID=1955775 RepID=A0A1B7NNF2_9EURO|nr:hypothetical protein ACJ72_07539 [Emergomyces africanus]
MLDTFIIINDDIQNLSNDDRILISLTASNMCSREPSVGSDNESDSESWTPPPPVLIEDNEVTREKWLIDKILESMLPEHDLIPGCEELVHEFHTQSGKEEIHRSLKQHGRPPLRNHFKKTQVTF